jgi:hypothetical protein
MEPTSALNTLTDEAVAQITNLGASVGTMGVAVLGVTAAIVGITIVLRIMKKG